MQPETGRPAVRVSIPAQAQYIRVARMTASAVGAALGCDVEDIEDLRIAVNELASTILTVSTGPAIDISLALDDDVLALEGTTPADTDPVLDPLTADIVGAVAEDVSVERRDGHARFAARMRLGRWDG